MNCPSRTVGKISIFFLDAVFSETFESKNVYRLSHAPQCVVRFYRYKSHTFAPATVERRRTTTRLYETPFGRTALILYSVSDDNVCTATYAPETRVFSTGSPRPSRGSCVDSGDVNADVSYYPPRSYTGTRSRIIGTDRRWTEKREIGKNRS